MGSHNAKYFVVKREDWQEFLTHHARGNKTNAASRLADKELPDAVVIRRQDVFAPTALWSYAHAARSIVELWEALELDKLIGADDFLAKQTLEIVADYFAEQASLSAMEMRKLPTP